MRKNKAVLRKHRYFILLLGEILATWFLSIQIIQYCTSTQQTVKKPISVSKFETPRQIKHRETVSWNLMLINHENSVPDYYAPDLLTLKNGCQVDRRILPDLQRMMNAARSQGLYPSVCSAYRTSERQSYLLEQDINKYLNQGYTENEAKRKAMMWVALPGRSEHQTGLAVDITAVDYPVLDVTQEQRKEQQWLMKNSWRYGFILRYPKDKTGITKIGYEPWHYRYVGKKAAREMKKKNLCLEEYLDRLN
ncbi:M15 family metallopeptidase [Anaerostipes sp.]|uniref:M15 family metallopeptidase n=1 Tax=Anaerostipes sp. TaxID=1872530 RepID=UPI0025C44365|nr:M15 family metallopeptidase [Anaerostipes sp.]MBS7009404.1 M15 family metallopeptidase [Anaerostipes sp.]